MTRIICISNEKGGVAKTTTAVNVAHAMTMLGKRVLLIDFDPQGSATLALGMEQSPATYDLLVDGEPLKKLVVQARDKLDLLASDYSLAEARDIVTAQYNSADPERRRRAAEKLKKALSRQLRVYDYVLIDCSPSLSVLNLNALMAADELLVPVSADFLSAAGTNQHLETLELIENLGGSVELTYIVPTRYDGRTNRARRIVEILKETFGGLVTDPIRTNTHLGESALYGQTIFEHRPNSNGAADYMALAKVVVGNE